MNSFIFIDEIAFFIAFKLASTKVVNVLWDRGAVLCANLSDGVLVCFLDGLSSLGVGFLFQQEIVETACEAVHLHVIEEQFVQACH